MPIIKERIFMLLQDPRVMKLMRDPKVQAIVMKVFRYRGRLEGAFDQGVQRIAGKLNLATQRDLRGLQRRIRHLERELREAEERLNEDQAAR
jgi:polyhydroxyalkanoate synthesis regulator phasin